MQSLLPANYFVILYAALYIISPFINIILNKLTNRGLAIFILSLMGVFSVYPTAVDILRQVTGNDLYGLSAISRIGSQAGFTVVNFIMMYCIGAFLRLYPIKKLTLWNKLIAILLNTAVITVWALLMPVPKGFGLRSAWSYCNPLVVLGAVLMFELFLDLRMKNSKVINELARASFTVFLLHSLFLDRIGIQEMVNKSTPFLMVHIICSIVVIYLICAACYFVYEKATRWLWNIVEKKIKLPMNYVEMEES